MWSGKEDVKKDIREGDYYVNCPECGYQVNLKIE